LAEIYEHKRCDNDLETPHTSLMPFGATNHSQKREKKGEKKKKKLLYLAKIVTQD